MLYVKYDVAFQLWIIYLIDKCIFENIIIIYCFTFYTLENSKLDVHS